ncbi:MAG: pilus assembly protein PilM [Candidatus Pacebacteria bacterium]|nr:pilus assembly protein PilM [Candidatus Paceibacterota bacterium]MBP9851155.1 pilus assembly protein PilM [Candidatus Paceibacterota bacterium]
MFRNSSHNFFSTPKFLEMPSFGLDISDESIKYIELLPTDKGIVIGSYGEKKIPAGVVELGEIKDPVKLEGLLTALKREQNIRSVRASILESQIYLFKLVLEKSGVANVRESIELSLEEHIPIPAEEAIFDYDIINETDTSLEIQVAAIQKKIIDNYLSVFTSVDLSVHSFELEAQAIARSIIKKGDPDTYMIVDFGERRTGIFIVTNGIVMFTSTVDMGGAVLNGMIEKHFKVTKEEAEKLKKQYGLQRNVANKEMFSVLLNSVSILKDELAKHFVYWHTHEDEDGIKNPPIKKILLCGGDSNLVGLPDYLSVTMKTEVEMANVWCNILNTEEYIPSIDFKDALSFAASLGLALGDFEL